MSVDGLGPPPDDHLPTEPPDGRWRPSAKAVVIDDAGRILLLDVHDPVDDVSWWELPGGGIEPGETSRQAVIREVAEETGLQVADADVGDACWERTVTFRWLGVQRWQRETVHIVRPRDLTLGAQHLTDDEQSSVRGLRWWEPADIARGTDVFYPGRLPTLLPAVLAGATIVEAFERYVPAPWRAPGT